jgi:hypothetical protein
MALAKKKKFRIGRDMKGLFLEAVIIQVHPTSPLVGNRDENRQPDAFRHSTGACDALGNIFGQAGKSKTDRHCKNKTYTHNSSLIFSDR